MYVNVTFADPLILRNSTRLQEHGIAIHRAGSETQIKIGLLST